MRGRGEGEEKGPRREDSPQVAGGEAAPEAGRSAP